MMTKSLALLAALAAFSSPAFADSYSGKHRSCDLRKSDGYYDTSARCKSRSTDETGFSANASDSDVDREQRRLDEKNDGNVNNNNYGGEQP